MIQQRKPLHPSCWLSMFFGFLWILSINAESLAEQKNIPLDFLNNQEHTPSKKSLWLQLSEVQKEALVDKGLDLIYIKPRGMSQTDEWVKIGVQDSEGVMASMAILPNGNLHTDLDLRLKSPAGAWIPQAFGDSYDQTYEAFEYIAPTTGIYTLHMQRWFMGSCNGVTGEYVALAYDIQ